MQVAGGGQRAGALAQRALDRRAGRRAAPPARRSRRRRAARVARTRSRMNVKRAPVGLVGVALGELAGQRGEVRLAARPGAGSRPRRRPTTRSDSDTRPASSSTRSSRKRRHCSRMSVERLARSPPGVTYGLPSRSPPIHEPKRQQRRHRDDLARVGRGERLLEVAVDRGHDVGERGDEPDQAARTSSSTVGDTARSSSEPHSSWTVGSSRRRASAHGHRRAARRGRAGRRRRARASRASCGGAPRSGARSARGGPRRRRAARATLVGARRPRRRGGATASRSEPRRGAGASRASRARRRRTRSLSSARLMSWNQRVSERTSSSASSRSEAGDEGRELVGGAVVARAGAARELDRPLVQLEDRVGLRAARRPPGRRRAAARGRSRTSGRRERRRRPSP